MNIGDIFKIKYPFVKCKYSMWDEEGGREVDSWRPGCEIDEGDGYGGEGEWYANAHGEMILEIISIHKPGKYPERIFYTRKWKDPDGSEFGKAKLRITVASNFKRLVKGFKYEYYLEE